MLLLNKYYFLHILLLFILLPSLTINSEFRIVVFAAIGLLYIQIIVAEIFTFHTIDKLLSLILFFIIYTSVVGELISQNSAIQQIQLYVFLLCIHISWFIIIEEPKSVILLVITILLFNFITVVLTYRELIINPEVARIISNSNELSDEFVKRGIGGYGLIYSNILLFPVLIIFTKLLFVKRMKIKYSLIIKVLLILNIVTIPILIIMAGYSIAIVLLILQIGYIFFFKRFSRLLFIKFFILAGMMGLLLFLLVIYQNEIRSLVAGTFYQYKVDDILETINNENSEGSVAGRTDRYMYSLESIKLSPFFGKLIYSQGITGGHSTILDLLGKYGIFIGGLFIYIILFIPLKFLKKLKFYKDEIIMVLISLTVVLLINRESMGFGITFILLSSIYTLYNNYIFEE